MKRTINMPAGLVLVWQMVLAAPVHHKLIFAITPLDARLVPRGGFYRVPFDHSHSSKIPPPTVGGCGSVVRLWCRSACVRVVSPISDDRAGIIPLETPAAIMAKGGGVQFRLDGRECR